MTRKRILTAGPASLPENNSSDSELSYDGLVELVEQTSGIPDSPKVSKPKSKTVASFFELECSEVDEEASDKNSFIDDD